MGWRRSGAAIGRETGVLANWKRNMMQTSGARQVLVCENRGKPGMGIAAELQKFARDQHLEIVTAAGKEAVRDLLQARPFACAVIDIGREGGEAQALVRFIGEGFPSLPLFVCNGFQIPGIAVRVQEYERIHYCEDPQDLDRFIASILEELSGKKKGTIEGILLANFLEWLGAEKLSGQVIVSQGKKKGILYMDRGRLIGASSGNPGDRTALAEISSWEKVNVEIKEGTVHGHSSSEGSPVLLAAAESQLRQPRPRAPGGGGSNIEILRLTRKGRTIVLRIEKFQRLIAAIRNVLADALLKTDVFLSADGHSLAGWNSHPAACSAFAGITRSLIDLLAASGFPAMGNYYLLDLADDRQALVIVSGDVQLGILLIRSRIPQGLLTNIVIPKALAALQESYVIEYPD
jgi:ActR/RegA family two-component response regulator